MTHLKLLKNPLNLVEKRRLPQFPFSFLTFKDFGKDPGQVFEVRDISLTGMQLLLKDGRPILEKGQEIDGELHWKGKSLKIKGIIIWEREKRLGVEFKHIRGLSSFLNIENILDAMQPLHKNPLNIEYPANLKYWLHSDGPVELFMWEHTDGEWSEFQIIYFKHFIEWVDGTGLKTGVVLTKRDLESSLFEENEFVFQIDKVIENKKLKEIIPFIDKIPNDFLPTNVINFLKLKLSV